MKMKIHIENPIKGRHYEAIFKNETIDNVTESDAEVQLRMDTYIAIMQEKASRGIGWGWSARTIKSEDMLPKWETILLQRRMETDPVSGEEYEVCDLDKEYTYQEFDLTEEYHKELNKKIKKDKGKNFRILAEDLYDVLKGHAWDNNLSLAQKEQLQTENATLFQYLKNHMPITAKPLIDALVADGTLITQDMLDDMALEYQEFEIANPDITIP